MWRIRIDSTNLTCLNIRRVSICALLARVCDKIGFQLPLCHRYKARSRHAKPWHILMDTKGMSVGVVMCTDAAFFSSALHSERDDASAVEEVDDVPPPPTIPLVSLSNLLKDEEWPCVEGGCDELLAQNWRLKARLQRCEAEAVEARSSLSALRCDVSKLRAEWALATVAAKREAAVQTEQTIARLSAAEALLEQRQLEARISSARAVATQALLAAQYERQRAEAEVEVLRRLDLERRLRTSDAANAACSAALSQVSTLRESLDAATKRIETLEQCCAKGDAAAKLSGTRAKLASAEAERLLAALVQTKIDLAAKEFELLTTKQQLLSPNKLENVTANSRKLAFGAEKNGFEQATPQGLSSGSTSPTSARNTPESQSNGTRAQLQSPTRFLCSPHDEDARPPDRDFVDRVDH